MQKTLAILFYLRKHKGDRDTEATIYLRITVDGKRVDFTTNRNIDPAVWDNKIGRAKGVKEEIKNLNIFLLNLENKVHREYNILESKNETITAESLRNKVLGLREEFQNLVDVFEFLNKQIKGKIGGEYAPATYKKYLYTLDKVKAFLLYQYKKTDIPLPELNHQFITNFDYYLKAHDELSQNTAMKYIKTLKRVVNVCLANEWITRNPFMNFKCSYKDPNRGYLSAEELSAIEKKTFMIHRLEVVRDIFVFACYTGLSYSDIGELSPKDIQSGIDREKWIIIDRIKTGTRSPIPLLPKALEIVEKYKDYPVNCNKGTLLPINSNQKMNAYLKEIADLCSIEKILTFHMARHTFATTVTLSNGVPIETVSKMLGHTSIKTTQIYSKVVDSKISDDMKNLKLKLSKMDQEKLQLKSIVG